MVDSEAQESNTFQVTYIGETRNSLYGNYQYRLSYCERDGEEYKLYLRFKDWHICEGDRIEAEMLNQDTLNSKTVQLVSRDSSQIGLDIDEMIDNATIDV